MEDPQKPRGPSESFFASTQDVRSAANRSGQIGDFHTPAALSEMLARDFDAECARKRTILIAIATGTELRIVG